MRTLLIDIALLNALPVRAGNLQLWGKLTKGMTESQAQAVLREQLTCERDKQFNEMTCTTKPFIKLGKEVAFLKLYFPKMKTLDRLWVWVDKGARCSDLFEGQGFPKTRSEADYRQAQISVCGKPYNQDFYSFSKAVIPVLNRKYGEYSVMEGGSRTKVWYSRGLQIQLQHQDYGKFGILYRQDPYSSSL